MLTHYNLMVEMAERQLDMERLAYPNGVTRRRMCNHIYLKIAGWRDRHPLRSSIQRLQAAGIDL